MVFDIEMVYEFCKDCKQFKSDANFHEGHEVIQLGHDTGKTIQCLDDLIQYGQDSLAEMEMDVNTARHVHAEIKETKRKFKSTLSIRIEKVVQDLRVALDEHSMDLLGDVDRKVETMEANTQTVIRTSRIKLDTANAFLKKAALTMPDDDGKFDENQLKELYNHFKSLEKVQRQQKPTIKSVNVNIKFPNTMKVKTQCRELAKEIVGEIENTKRPSLLNAQRQSIDVVNIDDFGDV